MVKMADRICNLQPPPAGWPGSRIAAYYEESLIIHDSLKHLSPRLADRLKSKIVDYRRYIP